MKNKFFSVFLLFVAYLNSAVSLAVETEVNVPRCTAFYQFNSRVKMPEFNFSAQVLKDLGEQTLELRLEDKRVLRVHASRMNNNVTLVFVNLDSSNSKSILEIYGLVSNQEHMSGSLEVSTDNFGITCYSEK